MSSHIKESDWKLFRQFHAIALERFCQRVLLEIERINADGARTFHQRYLDIFRVIERRDREIARTFDDLRRSTALAKLAAIQSRNLLQEEEFLRFSPETRSVVQALLEIQNV